MFTFLGKFKIRLNIRNRLILGFAAISLMLVAAVGTTVWKVNGIETITGRIVGLRMPTAAVSSAIVKDIHASLASLRGWMIIGNDKFKAERAGVWADIDAQREEMDRLSQTWTNPDNVKQWSELKAVLDEFRTAQQQVEDILAGRPRFTLEQADDLDTLKSQVGQILQNENMARMLSGPTFIDGTSVIDGTITAPM